MENFVVILTEASFSFDGNLDSWLNSNDDGAFAVNWQKLLHFNDAKQAYQAIDSFIAKETKVAQAEIQANSSSMTANDKVETERVGHDAYIQIQHSLNQDLGQTCIAFARCIDLNRIKDNHPLVLM